jgi:hypothetical protein
MISTTEQARATGQGIGQGIVAALQAEAATNRKMAAAKRAEQATNDALAKMVAEAHDPASRSSARPRTSVR